MVAKTGAYGPYISKRKNTFYATLKVPKDVQPILKRVRYIESLKTDSVTVAQRRAPKIVEPWRLEIAKARGENIEQVDKDAVWFRKALARTVSPDVRASLLEQIESIADDIQSEGPGGDPYAADPEDYYDPTAVKKAETFYQEATGTATDAMLEDWLGNLSDTPKTIDMKRADVLRLAKEFPTVSLVTSVAATKFLQRLHKEDLAPATLKKMASAWRGYWTYLQSVGVTADGPEVFKVALPKASKKNGDKRQPFAPADLPALWSAAKDDRDLSDLVKLAAYTGARIEELCSLTIERVDFKARTMTIEDAKSKAGNRVVPVHSELLPLLKARVGNREGGRILSGLTPNKYDDYSNAIGKRFGRLKTELGYDQRYVFHSIRKTVTTILENAGVPESTSAAVLGHDIPTMTYGLYSGGPTLEVKAKAVETIRYPVSL